MTSNTQSAGIPLGSRQWLFMDLAEPGITGTHFTRGFRFGTGGFMDITWTLGRAYVSFIHW